MDVVFSWMGTVPLQQQVSIRHGRGRSRLTGRDHPSRPTSKPESTLGSHSVPGRKTYHDVHETFDGDEKFDSMLRADSIVSDDVPKNYPSAEQVQQIRRCGKVRGGHSSVRACRGSYQFEGHLIKLDFRRTIQQNKSRYTHCTAWIKRSWMTSWMRRGSTRECSNMMTSAIMMSAKAMNRKL